MRKILGFILAYGSLTFIFVFFSSFKEDGFFGKFLALTFAVGLGYLSQRSFKSGREYKEKREEKCKEEQRKLKEERYKNEILENTSLTEESLVAYEQKGIMPLAYASNLILKSNEECRYYTNSTRLILKEKVVGYKGGSAGLDIRLTKGIGLRTGKHKGTPIRGDITEETEGKLYITDNRIIFMATKNSFDISMDKIVATEYYSDGIGIQDNKKTYTINLVAPNIPLSIIRVLIVANKASV